MRDLVNSGDIRDCLNVVDAEGANVAGATRRKKRERRKRSKPARRK